MENILSTILTLALIRTLWENCLIIFAAFLSDGKINALLISPHTEDYLLQMVIYPELMAYWKSISPENPLRRIIVSSIYSPLHSLFLHNIINNSIPEVSSQVKNSFHFVDKVNGKDFWI